MAAEGKPAVVEEEEDLDALWGGALSKQGSGGAAAVHGLRCSVRHSVGLITGLCGSSVTTHPDYFWLAAADEPPRQAAAQPPAQAEPSSSEGDSYFEGSDDDRCTRLAWAWLWARCSLQLAAACRSVTSCASFRLPLRKSLGRLACLPCPPCCAARTARHGEPRRRRPA